MDSTTFTPSYEAALRAYLASPDEESLADAYELGREALTSGFSLVDLIGLFFDVLRDTLVAANGADEQRVQIIRASEFLSETLSIDEMTRASYQEASETSARLMQLASTIAHEFRSPLTSILMAAGALEEELPKDTPETTRRLVGHVMAGVRMIKAQIDDLLDMVAFQAGTLSVSLVLIEPGVLIKDVLDRLKPVVKDAGLEFVISVADDLPQVLADRRRLEQVLSNLVTNAAKYGLSGRRIEVTVTGGEELLIQVRDYGPGISESDQEKLFQPFFRSRTHRRVSGLGIGLSLVADIVRAHRGTISVWSEEGQGALFTVRIPAAKAIDGQGGVAR